MADFSRRDDLIGWIPGNRAIDTGVVAEEMAILVRENAELRKLVSASQEAAQTYNGLTFRQLCNMLEREQLEIVPVDDPDDTRFVTFLQDHGGESPSLLDLIWLFRQRVLAPSIVHMDLEPNIRRFYNRLRYYGIVRQEGDSYPPSFVPTADGHRFILRLDAGIEKSDVDVDLGLSELKE
jgi:hypothetical protein